MIKIDFAPDANVIIVDVLIKNKNKKKKMRMALDTGATYMMIPWEIAKSLGLKPELSRNSIETITASGIEIVPIINLPYVEVGGNEVKNINSIVHDLPEKSYVDGLLGLSFLRNFDFHVLFSKGYIQLEKKYFNK